MTEIWPGSRLSLGGETTAGVLNLGAPDPFVLAFLLASALALILFYSRLVSAIGASSSFFRGAYSTMETLKYSTANTNTLVYNLDGVTGLKTGSTDRAGYCITVSMPVTRGEETHDLVLVLLGAETLGLRGQAAEILLRWARDYYAEHDFYFDE